MNGARFERLLPPVVMRRFYFPRTETLRTVPVDCRINYDINFIINIIIEQYF